MKNIFNITLTILILYFSFYYTNMVSNYIKNKDPIMIKIKTLKNKYYEEPIDAIILNNTIIPGVNGQFIDVDNSYIKMKKTKSFQESLLVFNEIKPTTSINNNKDKIVINGNKHLNNVSILLKIDNINILNNVLNDNYFNNINFIFSNNFLTDNYNIIKSIKNNIIINQDENIINNLDTIDYCYTKSTNTNNKCLVYNKFTIFPTFITSNYYYNTYQIIENGNILAYNISNDKNITEIKLLLNGIKNIGFKIVSLDELLKE